MGELVMEDLESMTASAARGDTTALRGIYEALSPRICGYLRMRGSEDPEGLTNDVFVKVLPRVAEVAGGYRGLRALTFTVAHGLLVDELRRRDRRPAMQSYDPTVDTRVQPSAEQQALDQLGEGTALTLLDLLPEDQRSVILLRVLGDLTVDETATAIGRSQAAVMKTQARALTTLRRLLDSDRRRPRTSRDEVSHEHGHA
ncbi:RNA polymerase sigma factor [Nocardioides zhouii]|nr:RNA polymerase sigma factor [Nocardioides zhouii]